MVLRDNVLKYCNERLDIGAFRDFSPNGLQVEGKRSVDSMITAVSASRELFERAAEEKADMIMVHHGILWDRDSHVLKGSLKKRVKILLEHDISLLAYHLPLDAHPEIGNNAAALFQLGVDQLEEFDGIGYEGTIQTSTIHDLLEKIKILYESDPLTFLHGPDYVTRIALCSGGAAKRLSLAIDHDVHAFITGEPSEPAMHLAKEAGVHFIAAGHYHTEKIGIQRLGAQVSDYFDIPVKFVDIPNPV